MLPMVLAVLYSKGFADDKKTLIKSEINDILTPEVTNNNNLRRSFISYFSIQTLFAVFQGSISLLPLIAIAL